MATDSPEPPAKRLKTSISEADPQEPCRSLCAICFADDGRAIRGEIDCCNHYFCFICIVEWSKTESRCPLCRRRFSAVRRPPIPGVFHRHRLISVPVRDQASNTSNDADPYAEALCNVCHTAGDDCLLLLCDLCDSASHTYCVGLGSTVPEGDWFCHDCFVSRAEHDNSEEDVKEDTTKVLSSLVAEKIPLRASSHISPSGVEKKPDDSNARTLDRCRNVHSHIRAMRQNWHTLQSGSLNFSSDLLGHCRLSQKQESKSGAVGFGSYNTVRAWKMMEIAMSSSSKERVNGSSRNVVARERAVMEKVPRHDNFAKEIKVSGMFEPCGSQNITSARENQSLLLQENENQALRQRGTSCSKLDVRNEHIRVHKERSCEDDTKIEIQSLVKLNLKRLSRDKRLGVEAFKEMARLATHTILAACGQEHRKKYARHSFPRSLCPHIEISHQIPKSNVMPQSCQQCFDSFVKDVVSSILCEKLGSAKSG